MLLPKESNALPFYGSKIVFYRTYNFGRVPIVLDRSNSFWLGPSCFGQVQIIKNKPWKYNLYLTKMIWTWPKQFAPIEEKTQQLCEPHPNISHYPLINYPGLCSKTNRRHPGKDYDETNVHFEGVSDDRQTLLTEVPINDEDEEAWLHSDHPTATTMTLAGRKWYMAKVSF